MTSPSGKDSPGKSPALGLGTVRKTSAQKEKCYPNERNWNRSSKTSVLRNMKEHKFCKEENVCNIEQQRMFVM